MVRELIRERQFRDPETPEQIKAIRAALIEAERGGFTDRSVVEIWEEARLQDRARNA